MAERRRIKGPISGYDYPVLNAIIQWLRELRERLRKRVYGQLRLTNLIETTETTTKTTETKTKIYSNIETYEIFEDKQTGTIKVRVHRKAERGG